MKTEVIYSSSKDEPRILVRLSVREARLIIDGHANVTGTLKSDLKKAAEFCKK